MKMCACCGAMVAVEEACCPKCGEASWCADVGPELQLVQVERELAKPSKKRFKE